jgi:hypothetical protein
MFGGKLNHESEFYISGLKLSGIESVDISYAQQNGVIKPIGFSKGLSIVNGEPQKSLSLTRNLLYQDPILNYTGDLAMDGSINYGEYCYGFKKGYLTEYMVNCAIGAIPRVSVNAVILDELTRSSNSIGNITHPNIHIPNQGSISMRCDNSTTNRVIGFDYSIKCNRKAFFTIGSELPQEVLLIPPLEYSASVQIEIDDAFLQDSDNYLSNRENKTVSFSVSGRNNQSIQNLTIPKASLISEQINASSDGLLRLTLNYIGHS